MIPQFFQVDCERVTDEGINGLSECCSQLKAIDFKGMPFVWDVSLLRLVGANTHLQYLSLAESSLTDAMLMKVAECLSGSVSVTYLKIPGHTSHQLFCAKYFVQNLIAKVVLLALVTFLFQVFFEYSLLPEAKCLPLLCRVFVLFYSLFLSLLILSTRTLF